jgi:predicted RNase H-like nuclease (RuvC/YqgF family)
VSPATFAVLAGVVSALISPLIAYVVATRRLSGKVNTSEASELWKESSSIREDYRERLRYSDESIRRLEGRVQNLEASNDELLAENRQLRLRVDELQKENTELHAQINGIKRKVNGD